MKHIALTAAFLAGMFAGLPSEAGNWSDDDTKWQAAYLALHVADWGQTRDIAARPGRYTEMNPMLGDHPSRKRVDSHFVVTAIMHTAVSYVLPPDWRRLWQHISVGVGVGTVVQNARIGLQINFK